MYELDDELRDLNKTMYQHFGTVIPLWQLPQTVSNDEIRSAVEKSVEEGRNLLPELLGYQAGAGDRRH